MKILHMVAFLLLVVGGLNWLLVGLFDFDLVYKLLGGINSSLVKIVYILVGVAAVIELVTHPKNCKMCKPSNVQM